MQNRIPDPARHIVVAIVKARAERIQCLCWGVQRRRIDPLIVWIQVVAEEFEVREVAEIPKKRDLDQLGMAYPGDVKRLLGLERLPQREPVWEKIMATEATVIEISQIDQPL